MCFFRKTVAARNGSKLRLAGEWETRTLQINLLLSSCFGWNQGHFHSHLQYLPPTVESGFSRPRDFECASTPTTGSSVAGPFRTKGLSMSAQRQPACRMDDTSFSVYRQLTTPGDYMMITNEKKINWAPLDMAYSIIERTAYTRFHELSSPLAQQTDSLRWSLVNPFTSGCSLRTKYHPTINAARCSCCGQKLCQLLVCVACTYYL